MFSFFKKKESIPKVEDKVWMNEQAKWNGCLQMLKDNANVVFVVWFDETFTNLNSFLQSNQYTNNVIMYRQAITQDATNYIFAEHYPFVVKETDLFKRLGLEKVTVLSSLDEPFYEQFGSDKIVATLSKLNMHENEMLEHNFISAAIKKALEKIADKVIIDNTAESQKEWFARNMNK